MSSPAILVAFLVAGSAAAADRKPFAWPTPDVVQATDIAGTVRAGGVPVRLKAVRVKHRLDELAVLYIDTFQRAGFYIPPNEDQFSLYAEPSLTALDTARLIAYTVIFQDNHDGTTTLILGESNLKLRGVPATSEDVPLFPGAHGVLRADAEGASTLGYRAKASSADVFGFYRDTLGRSGYRETSSDASVLVLQRGNQELTITVQQERDDAHVGVISRRIASDG